MALSVSRPQSFSGFCCECACLTAIRFGAVALNFARSAAGTLAVKLEALPADAALWRAPSMLLTVLVARSCTPMPVPLSVYATTQPCLRPHSPAVHDLATS